MGHSFELFSLKISKAQKYFSLLVQGIDRGLIVVMVILFSYVKRKRTQHYYWYLLIITWVSCILRHSRDTRGLRWSSNMVCQFGFLFRVELRYQAASIAVIIMKASVQNRWSAWKDAITSGLVDLSWRFNVGFRSWNLLPAQISSAKAPGPLCTNRHLLKNIGVAITGFVHKSIEKGHGVIVTCEKHLWPSSHTSCF